MISAKLKQIYASAPTDVRYVETLAFSHSLFPKTYYLTNDNKSWDFLLENGTTVKFIAYPFKTVLPVQDKLGQQDLSVTLANIGHEMITPLELANTKPSEPIKCVYRVYLDKDLSACQNDPPLTLTITGIDLTRDTVSAVATRADVLNRAYPYTFYRTTEFPGLRR